MARSSTVTLHGSQPAGSELNNASRHVLTQRKGCLVSWAKLRGKEGASPPSPCLPGCQQVVWAEFNGRTRIQSAVVQA